MYRYHPDDPRSSLEGYEGSLTQDEEAALEELQSAANGLDLRLVRGDYGDGFGGEDNPVEPLRLCLLRFLRGNAFSVRDALSQLKDCVDYRQKHPTDKLLSMSPRDVLACSVENFNSFYPRWLMGYDRLGRPIIATQYGSLRLWEMTKLTTVDRMTELHAREQELLLRLLRRRTLEGGLGLGGGGGGTGSGVARADGGGRGEGVKADGGSARLGGGDYRHIVDTAVVIIDTAGLTLRHVTKAFVRLFKMRAHMDQLLFPEILGKCFIVNTPSLFSYVWTMFSPLVDERTRSKIAIIARPQDWKKTLQEIADADQLSPEYGGTGRRREELPSLADALFAAGSCGSGGSGLSGRAGSGKSGGGVSGGDSGGDSGSERGNQRGEGGVGPRAQLSPPRDSSNIVPRSPCRDFASAGREQGRRCGQDGEEEKLGGEEKGDEEEVALEGIGRRTWFAAAAWAWSAWGGRGGAAEGARDLDDAVESVGTCDEEFFDALAELDQSHTYRGGSDVRPRGRSSRLRSESDRGAGGADGATNSLDDIETGGLPSSSPKGTLVWRKSWGGSAADLAERITPPAPASRAALGSTAAAAAAAGGKTSARRLLSASLEWCCAPVLRRLNRESVEQLVRWLCLANAVSALLAVAVVVAGAFSLSRATVLGLQLSAITAVCLGSLLLLLVLLGTAGARLRNRFSLLAFAALEGAVAFGLLMSGAWCLALAGGSATLSDLTWQALADEDQVSGTKEKFIGGARSRLLVLGAAGLALALFSVVGPCLLASVLLSKIRNLEEERARPDDRLGGGGDGAEKRFIQLRRSAHEANALCTIFACVCTGYGGYALSFTIALGLEANVTSTYLLVAGGYLLLLAGAVGVWAAKSGRPDAFRIHHGALLPAGALYASLTVVQLVSVGSSDRHVAAAWETLRPRGEKLFSVQASVRTMLIVGGVLSAVTFALAVCSTVTSYATRDALLSLPEGSTRRHRRLARLSRGEKMVAAWALALAATSTFIDGTFAVFSAWLAREGEQADVWCLVLWRAMGRGDRRYVEGETFIVATAVIVAAVIGPGALLYAWAVYCRKGYRFSVGILVCTASLHTQVLRYVTSASSSSSMASAGSGSKAFFIAASVVLALLQVVGALVALLYNVRGMTRRVHAAEVQYRALLLEHGRLSGKFYATAAAAAEYGGKNGVVEIRGRACSRGRDDAFRRKDGGDAEQAVLRQRTGS